MLATSRAFFAERGILEVDCPLLSASASVDAHIDLIPVTYQKNQIRYLHSSPEYGMKRLLAEGVGDIYQLSHVFRDGEHGRKHNPEFMMVEWYRCGITFHDMIVETAAFIQLFVGSGLPIQMISYREALQRYAGIDYVQMTPDDLTAFLQKKGIPPYSPNLSKDDLLNLILGALVEPILGQSGLTVLTHYPASQAALAKTITLGNELVAERFEVYFQGIELANGYHELCNAQEQRQRLEEANQERIALGKQSLPIDENFLQALSKGLPDCCGVAVGFDRLMMLRQGVSSLEEILPFGWSIS